MKLLSIKCFVSSYWMLIFTPAVEMDNIVTLFQWTTDWKVDSMIISDCSSEEKLHLGSYGDMLNVVVLPKSWRTDQLYPCTIHWFSEFLADYITDYQQSCTVFVDFRRTVKAFFLVVMLPSTTRLHFSYRCSTLLLVPLGFYSEWQWMSIVHRFYAAYISSSQFKRGFQAISRYRITRWGHVFVMTRNPHISCRRATMAFFRVNQMTMYSCSQYWQPNDRMLIVPSNKRLG